MPGYELELFIDLSSVEKAELTCSICHDIFRSPVVTNCCQQTFCEDCITGWLSTSNSCPYDRKKLKASNLLRPPRLLLNMLRNLKLMCPFKDKGCDEILLLENYDNHIMLCRFNKKICSTCDCELQSEHNCVQSLRDVNGNLKQDIELALTQNQLLSRKLLESKCENETLLQTIQDLSNKKVLRTKVISKLSDYQLIVESRRYLDTPVVNHRNTTDDVMNKIVDIVKDVLKYEQNLNNVCKYIKELIETEFDGLWHCSAFYDDIGGHAFTFDDMYFVGITFGKLRITVHKVYDDINIQKLAQLLHTEKISEELIIEKTDMTEEYIIVIKEITLNAIKTSNNLSVLTKYISKEVAKRLDGVWQSFAFRAFLANCYVCPKVGRFISLTISDLNIVVFQV